MQVWVGQWRRTCNSCACIYVCTATAGHCHSCCALRGRATAFSLRVRVATYVRLQLVALLPRVDRSMASASRNIASYDLYDCDEATGRCSVASTAFGRKSTGSKDLQTYADVRTVAGRGVHGRTSNGQRAHAHTASSATVLPQALAMYMFAGFLLAGASVVIVLGLLCARMKPLCVWLRSRRAGDGPKSPYHARRRSQGGASPDAVLPYSNGGSRRHRRRHSAVRARKGSPAHVPQLEPAPRGSDSWWRLHGGAMLLTIFVVVATYVCGGGCCPLIRRGCGTQHDVCPYTLRLTAERWS